ncbi:MAG: hypothetical protein KAW92_03675 [Candidatus Cloacimonetes bacterium]|nr:hypothetical protein [Candidatus Cloacimonadota bacterium]
MRPFRVAIDFDGTIVENKYPKIGPLKDNAVHAINLLKELGCYIIITSCRTNSTLYPSLLARANQAQIMQMFLIKNGIPFDEVDDGCQGKVVADVYIDDHAIRFEDNWNEIVHIINIMEKD